MQKLGWGFRIAAVTIGILGLVFGVILTLVFWPQGAFKAVSGGVLALIFSFGCLYVGFTGDQEKVEQAIDKTPSWLFWWPF